MWTKYRDREAQPHVVSPTTHVHGAVKHISYRLTVICLLSSMLLTDVSRMSAALPLPTSTQRRNRLLTSHTDVPYRRPPAVKQLIRKQTDLATIDGHVIPSAISPRSRSLLLQADPRVFSGERDRCAKRRSSSVASFVVSRYAFGALHIARNARRVARQRDLLLVLGATWSQP